MNNQASATGIEEKVCQDIAHRQKMGISKYGTSVADNPLPLSRWMQHAYEEIIDLPVYLKRAKEEAEKLEEMLHSAWGVIANAGAGNWELESQEWRAAAEVWRDKYHNRFWPKAPAAQSEPATDNSEWFVFGRAVIQTGYKITNVMPARRDTKGNVQIRSDGNWIDIPQNARLIRFHYD